MSFFYLGFAFLSVEVFRVHGRSSREKFWWKIVKFSNLSGYMVHFLSGSKSFKTGDLLDKKTYFDSDLQFCEIDMVK